MGPIKFQSFLATDATAEHDQRSFFHGPRKVVGKLLIMNYADDDISSITSSIHKPKMARNDPMFNNYSYRSVESPDDDDDDQNQQNSELFNSFLTFDDSLDEDQASIVSGYLHQNPVYTSAPIGVGGHSNGSSSSHLQGNSTLGGGTGKTQKGRKEKVAFKTKSEIEILDDGFKWRKYGKKMVKNSPNPRNYYRCSVEGCSVKKRVERDVDDARYVITTYEGVHNHEGPTKRLM